MPPSAVFLILFGCGVGVALAAGLRLAVMAACHELFPGSAGLGLLASGLLAGAGGGAIAGGAVSLSLRRLLRQPAAAMGIFVVLWAMGTGVAAIIWPAAIYQAPLGLGAITALVGLAILPMAPRPLSDGL